MSLGDGDCLVGSEAEIDQRKKNRMIEMHLSAGGSGSDVVLTMVKVDVWLLDPKAQRSRW